MASVAVSLPVPAGALPSGHVASLDALRGLAALMVFAHHLTREGFGFGPLQPLMAGGNNGVTVFFVLSGFLLFEPFVRGGVDVRTYYVRRFLRIMPGYVLALVGLTFLTADQSFARAPATYLLFLQNYDPTLFQRFAGAAWTLQLEVTFYLLLPLIAVPLLRWLRPDVGRPGFVLGLLAVVSLAIGWPTIVWMGNGVAGLLVASLFPLMFWSFVPGMVLALVAVRRPDQLRSLASRPMIAAGIALLLAGFWLGLGYGNLFSACGAFLVIAALIVHRPGGKVLVRVALISGALSYAFYLWHGDLIDQLVRHGWTGWTLVAAALALAVGISAVSYLVVEHPGQRLGRRVSAWLDRTRRLPAATAPMPVPAEATP